MNILITGALGHIGSKLIRELPPFFPDSNFILLDNLLTQRYCSLFNLNPLFNFRFIEGDFQNQVLLNSLGEIDIVIHLAAITDADSSFEKKEEIELINFEGTKTLAHYCLETNTPIIYLSTTSVYGPKNLEIDESCPPEELNPQSPYATSKLKSEYYLKSLANKNLKFCICRFGTIYGVSPGIRFHTAVNKFCWQAVNQIPLSIWKTALNQCRPYLDLNDACLAIKHIISKKLFNNEIYNILSGNYTVQNIIETIEASLTHKIEKNFVDSPIMNQLSYKVSNKKIIDTGYKPTRNLNDSIKETLDLFSGIR